MGTLDKLIFGLRTVFDAVGTELPRRTQIQFIGQCIDDPIGDKVIVSGSASSSLKTELVIVAGLQGAASTDDQSAGSRVVDLSTYADELGPLVRGVRFRAVIENAEHSALYYSEVVLFDVTHNVEVASTTLSNSAAVDRGVAAEYVSELLTVGSDDGDMRNDEATLYRVFVRGVGTLGGSDQAIVSGALVEVVYEE